jgi:hypothetical protein
MFLLHTVYESSVFSVVSAGDDSTQPTVIYVYHSFVTVVLQCRYSGVTMARNSDAEQWSYSGVCYNGVTVVSKWSCHNVTVVLKWCEFHTCITLVLQSCYSSVTVVLN